MMMRHTQSLLVTIEIIFGSLVACNGEPTVEELAYHWAPINYQDINKKEAQGSKYLVTNVDRSGVWDVSRNWDEFGTYPLNAWV
jgi:hypothetical protein